MYCNNMNNKFVNGVSLPGESLSVEQSVCERRMNFTTTELEVLVEKLTTLYV